MLQVSDAAVEALREMTAGAGLRLRGHEVDGEVEVELGTADAPIADDQVVEQGGVRVFLDPVAAAALEDQVLDVEPHGDHVHFTFNPQRRDSTP
jgi:Fe-S cluster assembly iron-binding protein IscA